MRTLLVLLPLLALGGCYKTNLTNFSDAGSPGREVKVWTHSVIIGLVPLTEVDIRKECGDKGVWSVSTRMNGWQALLAGITFSIYTPTTAKITCKG